MTAPLILFVIGWILYIVVASGFGVNAGLLALLYFWFGAICSLIVERLIES